MLLKNRYEYHPQTDFIADGRAAKVYKAFDTHKNQNVIIKFYHSISLLPSAFAANMSNIKALQHENLVQLFDYFEFEHVNYFGQVDKIRIGVWEYVAHAKTINATTVDAEIAARNILAGLQYLHQNNYQHLDLNPQNVLVSANGAIKLNNYGISNQIKNGKSIGSVLLNSASYYYAPEYFDVENADIKANADLWSFGLLFSEIVNGKKSFDGTATDSVETIHNNILNIRPQVSSDVKEVYGVMIQQCLKHDSTNRIQSVEDLLTTLESYDRNKRFNSVLPLSMEQFSSRYAFDKQNNLDKSSSTVLVYEAFDNLYDEKVSLCLYQGEATAASFEGVFKLNKKAHLFKLIENEQISLASVVSIRDEKEEKDTATIEVAEIEQLIEEDLSPNKDGIVSEKTTATVDLNEEWQASIGKITATANEIEEDILEEIAEPTNEIEEDILEEIAEPTNEIEEDILEEIAEPTNEIEEDILEEIAEPTNEIEEDILEEIAEPTNEIEEDILEEIAEPTNEIEEDILEEIAEPTNEIEEETTDFANEIAADLKAVEESIKNEEATSLDAEIQAIIAENQDREEEAVFSTEVIRKEALKELQLEMSQNKVEEGGIDDAEIQAIIAENERDKEASLSTEVIRMEALKELEAEMKAEAEEKEEEEQPIVFVQDDVPVSSSPTEIFRREAMEQVLKDMDKLLSKD